MGSQEALGVVLSESPMRRLFGRLGVRRKVPRPLDGEWLVQQSYGRAAVRPYMPSTNRISSGVRSYRR
jgi:hypothetical protein